MKRALVVIIVIILGCCGYLYYDWHTKTKKQAAEPSIPQYSWTDTQGIRHFTDSPPPKDATNVKKTKGYQYVDPALVVIIKNKVVEYYGQVREKLFKPKKKKRRKE
jgi:hypothetical protein